MRYLVFQLYGPLASWGEPATGEIRRSATHPGRSAIVGLVAAALGVARNEEHRLRALRDSVDIAVKQESSGVRMQDYHTAQVPGHDRRAWRLTRRDELSGPREKLYTILSTREYRCDGYWKIALRAHHGSPWSLDEFGEALQRPFFPLYLGRRSCPPAAPLFPQIIQAEGVKAALDTEFPLFTDMGVNEEKGRLGLRIEGVAYSWEGEGGDLERQETRYPYDQPLHRGRWQFASRAEYWHHQVEEKS